MGRKHSLGQIHSQHTVIQNPVIFGCTTTCHDRGHPVVEVGTHPSPLPPPCGPINSCTRRVPLVGLMPLRHPFVVPNPSSIPQHMTCLNTLKMRSWVTNHHGEPLFIYLLEFLCKKLVCCHGILKCVSGYVIVTFYVTDFFTEKTRLS